MFIIFRICGVLALSVVFYVVCVFFVYVNFRLCGGASKVSRFNPIPVRLF